VVGVNVEKVGPTAWGGRTTGWEQTSCPTRPSGDLAPTQGGQTLKLTGYVTVSLHTLNRSFKLQECEEGRIGTRILY